MDIIEYDSNKYKIEYITGSGYAISKWNGKRFSFGFGAIASHEEAVKIIQSGGYESQMKIFKVTAILIVIIIASALVSLI